MIYLYIWNICILLSVVYSLFLHRNIKLYDYAELIYWWTMGCFQFWSIMNRVTINKQILEKAMASHSSTFDWKIPWMEEPGSCSPWSRQELDTTEWLHFHFSLSRIGEEMATHSIVLAWRIPGTGEPGGLSSLGSHRVRHDWSDLATAAIILQYCATIKNTNIID